jgi:hypothetical protein
VPGRGAVTAGAALTPRTLWIFGVPWWMSYDSTPRASRERDRDSLTAPLPAGRVGAGRSAATAAGVVDPTSRLRGTRRPAGRCPGPDIPLHLTCTLGALPRCGRDAGRRPGQSTALAVVRSRPAAGRHKEDYAEQHAWHDRGSWHGPHNGTDQYVPLTRPHQEGVRGSSRSCVVLGDEPDGLRMLKLLTAELSHCVGEFVSVARTAVVADPAPAWAAGRPEPTPARAPAPCRTVSSPAPYGPLRVAA